MIPFRGWPCFGGVGFIGLGLGWLKKVCAPATYLSSA